MDSRKWGWITHMLKTDISVLNSQFSSQNHLFFIDTVATNFLPAILKHRCLKFPQKHNEMQNNLSITRLGFVLSLRC